MCPAQWNGRATVALLRTFFEFAAAPQDYDAGMALRRALKSFIENESLVEDLLEVIHIAPSPPGSADTRYAFVCDV